MNAIIIAIGDELITGQAVDTNSAYLSRKLGRRGIETIEHRTVGDDRGAIAAAITAATGCAEIVLITGGLGPTPDDLTRQALADAMGCELVLDEACLREIEEFFRRRKRRMVPANRAQAMIPAGGHAMANALGTAPGVRATLAGAEVFVMPGVPSEMRAMFDNAVAPLLPRGRSVILYRILHSFGRGESDIAVEIADLMNSHGAVSVGTTVAAGMVSMRVTSRADSEEGAKRQAGEVLGEIRARLGEIVIGEGEATLASVTGGLLGAAGLTLSTAESCTGGMVGQMITDVPGASEYYLGGVVAYSNAAKRDMLGVAAETLDAHGAVSEPVATAMAEGARTWFASDWAVSLTGIAGPTGGSEEKPVGLVYIGLCGPGGTEVHRHVFAGARRIVRRRAALTALNYLRLAIL